MQVSVLGCSGGVGVGLRTTTIKLNNDVLIDAGTGVGDMPLEQMASIRHIFLTHSHLDHVVSIPFLVDSVFDQIQEEPVVIHGLEATIEALRAHLFNNVIWPDFSILPTSQKPVLKYQVMNPGESIRISGCEIEMVPVNHIVPGVGYIVKGPEKTFAFSGDTTTNDTFWKRLNELDKLDWLMVEAAFPDSDIEICRRSGHYCPSLLSEDIQKLKHQPEVYISHNKPGGEDIIFASCEKQITSHRVHRLNVGQQFPL